MTELPIDENTPRILIVEDEPKLGQLLIDYLRAASYAPTLISHGDQAICAPDTTGSDTVGSDAPWHRWPDAVSGDSSFF